MGGRGGEVNLQWYSILTREGEEAKFQVTSFCPNQVKLN